ncbi:UNVERIFIED_CONTAM: hypothetical protein FKN15_000359 [Acipenser sinensis]
MKHEEAQRRIELMKEFVKEYEKEKQGIEKLLTELSEIADLLDKVDRDCTIAKTTGSSAGVIGGVLNIVGICLVPVTSGASLGLSIAGAITALAGSFTSGVAQIIKFGKDGKANKRVMEILEIIYTKIIALRKSCKIALPQCNWNIEEADLTDTVKTCLGAAAAGLVDAAVVAAADVVIDAAVSLDAAAGVTPNLSDDGAAVGFAVDAAVSGFAGKVGRVLANLIDDAAGKVGCVLANLIDDAAGKVGCVLANLIDDAAGKVGCVLANLIDDAAGKVGCVLANLIDDAAGKVGCVLANLIDDAAAVTLKSTGRLVGGVVSGLFVVWDVNLIGVNAKKLHEGSPTERAQEIRKLVETGKLDLAKVEEVNSDIKIHKLVETGELDPAQLEEVNSDIKNIF